MFVVDTRRKLCCITVIIAEICWGLTMCQDFLKWLFNPQGRYCSYSSFRAQSTKRWTCSGSHSHCRDPRSVMALGKQEAPAVKASTVRVVGRSHAGSLLGKSRQLLPRDQSFYSWKMFSILLQIYIWPAEETIWWNESRKQRKCLITLNSRTKPIIASELSLLGFVNVSGLVIWSKSMILSAPADLFL